MNHEDVGRFWEGNAEAWTTLARAGYDVYRDGFNTPAFFAMLPDVKGPVGLDIGCGEGHNTRLIAGRGARMTGVDISPTFVRYANEAEEEHPLGIRYEVASAANLPFEDASFDFATAFMSPMESPTPASIRRTARMSVVKTGSPTRSRSEATSSGSTARSRSGSLAQARPRCGRGGAKDPLLDLAVQPAEVASDLDRVGEPFFTTDILAVLRIEAGVGDGELQEPPRPENPKDLREDAPGLRHVHEAHKRRGEIEARVLEGKVRGARYPVMRAPCPASSLVLCSSPQPISRPASSSTSGSIAKNAGVLKPSR